MHLQLEEMHCRHRHPVDLTPILLSSKDFAFLYCSSGQMDVAVASHRSVAVSGPGPSQTWRDVRPESGKRCVADMDQPARTICSELTAARFSRADDINGQVRGARCFVVFKESHPMCEGRIVSLD